MRSKKSEINRLSDLIDLKFNEKITTFTRDFYRFFY